MQPLDATEAAILVSVELGEWQSMPDVAEAIRRYQSYAASSLISVETPVSLVD